MLFRSERVFYFFKKFSLPSAMVIALGKATSKGPLCRVPGPALGKEFSFFCFFCPIIFCEAFPHYLKLHVQIWDNFDFFCYISLVFFVSLNFMEYFKFELQVHGIIEFGRSKNDIHDIWCMLRPYPGTHMKFRASC